MQTFLPYDNFHLSAICLDSQRLRKQRAEVVQILDALDAKKNRLYNHPACKMWRGFRDALVAYGLVICTEIINRGYEDNTYEKIKNYKTVEGIPTQENVPIPKWIGNEAFHASHRGNLLRKFPEWYSAFGWKESPILPYIWPVNHDPRLFI